MSRIIRFMFFIFFLGSPLGQVVYAAMYVYPMEASINKNGVSQIRLLSQDEDVQFVKVTLKRVFKPGTMQESEFSANAEDLTELVITPPKIAISAGGERIVRLVSITPPKKETTWRAYFESVSKDYFMSAAPGNNKENTASVGVNVVWGVLLHVAPKNVISSLKINSKNGKLINDGTIRIPVREIGVCASEGQCQWEKIAVTVYPETEVSIPRMVLSADKKYRIKYLNWLTNEIEETSLN